MRSYRTAILFLAVIFTVVTAGCSGTMSPVSKAKATLDVVPAEIFLSPALIKSPVSFKGAGFQPNEMVSVEMVVPKGLEIKGVGKDEDAVGLAFGTADKDGNFSAAMQPTATLNWFFQVGWTPLLRPDFKQAKPLPPGIYQINATGMDSGIAGSSNLKIVPPPKQPQK
ncbi:MAG: hypothetical protein CO107_06620 [Deltaproteobacteria bacterium CG_4_9_14_3_um_filter_51_14]|nr:hypothetical protein [bacterium]PJB36837.1 MAG: hypothetical protein CO107_06620 [Deltaproteobacteria bacterium CG_4_9_14_3_um_filter_51_14]